MHSSSQSGTARNSAAVDAREDARFVGFFDEFNAGRYYEAHDVLEAKWLAERPTVDANFFKGLIQLAGAFVHVQKGRPGPASSLLRSAQGILAAYPEIHHGLDQRPLRRLVHDWLELLASASGEVPALLETRRPSLWLTGRANGTHLADTGERSGGPMDQTRQPLEEGRPLSGDLRLRLNHGGYRGETIDIAAVLRQDLEFAAAHEWTPEWLSASGVPQLLTLTRRADPARRRVYISTGIHGDEPAGPLAIRELLQLNRWPESTEICLCPCLNPTGFPLNHRENALGFDLNRDYRHLETAEVRAHVEWLQRLPRFDLTVCVHEDWEAHGFYLYELNPDAHSSPAQRVIDAVARVCPIDLSDEIEGRAARGGIIRPDLDPQLRPQWPEAFYLLQNKTRLSYTLEAPSDFPLQVRVQALVAGLRVLIDAPAAAPQAWRPGGQPA